VAVEADRTSDGRKMLAVAAETMADRINWRFRKRIPLLARMLLPILLAAAARP
jgi:hypothetical protein